MKESISPIPNRLKEFATHGFPVEPTTENLEARYAESPEQKVIDLYTLLVPAIADVVKRATADDLNPESKGPKVFPFSFDSLRKVASERLTNATSEHIQETAYSSQDPLILLATERAGSLKALIGRGNKTATDVMCKTLTYLPYAYRRKYPGEPVTPDSLVSLAQWNYPFVAWQAKINLEGNADMSQYGTGERCPAFHGAFAGTELEENDRLYFPEKLLRDVAPNYDAPMVERDIWGPRRVLRCPALYSHAIKSLWDWHLLFAKNIYRNILMDNQYRVTQTT